MDGGSIGHTLLHTCRALHGDLDAALSCSQEGPALRGEAGPVPVVVERRGKAVTQSITAEAFPDVLATWSIDCSGLIISEQRKLDRAEFDAER